ncbi:MAG: helix-turn-helix domain-containing protein [Pseudonocardia sp.]
MTPPSPRASRHRLGQELRSYREAAGLLIERAATALECSQSKVSRLETGKGIPRTRDVRDLLDLYKVDDPAIRTRLLGLAAAGQTEDWWSAYRDVVRGEMFADHLLRYVEVEQEASQIRSWEPELFHGLLQTRGYAEAIAANFFPDRTDQEHTRFAEFRLRRQEVLRSGDEREFAMYVGEAALVRPIGSPGVMWTQLSSLLKSLEGELGAVDFRVLPLDVASPASAGGPFAIMRFADEDDRDLVYLENRESADYLGGEEIIGRYEQKFAELGTETLSRAESLGRLADAVKVWEGRV